MQVALGAKIGYDVQIMRVVIKALLACAGLAACVAVVPASAMGSSSPVIESESASNVTATDATLNATINTNGYYTSYEFEVDTNGSYGYTQMVCPLPLPGSAQCMAIIDGYAPPITEPGPESIPAGSGVQTVSLDLASIGATLHPGVTYHYRVIAANTSGGGTVAGPDQTFTTPPGSPSPPVIESKSVGHITSTDATIETQINTGGRETTYEVWVGAYPECIEEQMQACESSGGGPAGTGSIVGTIPAGSSSHTIIVDVAKAWHTLKPSSEYIYSVSATNSNWSYEGSAYGGNETFKTSAVPRPVIESESVSHLSSTDATLEAQINTEGFESTYEFDLVEGWACEEANPPCEPPVRLVTIPGGKLLGSFVGQRVSVDLNSVGVRLGPNGRYEYSVTATNAGGTTQGQGQTFRPLEEVAQPLTTKAPAGGSGSTSGPGASGTQASGPAALGTTNPLATSSGSPSVRARVTATHHRKRRHHKRRRHPRSKNARRERRKS